MHNSQETRETQHLKPRVWDELGKQWSTFLGILFSPFVLILIFVTVTLIVVSFLSPGKDDMHPIVFSVLTVIISIFSGLVGAIISKRWNDITEGGILVTRGKSAIRGLKLLLLNITAIEKRIKVYLSKLGEEDDEKPVIRMTYEELIERCNSLQEEAINAIEEWQDIVPEANLKTQIGTISNLKSEQATLEEQITHLKKESAETKEVSKGEKEELRKFLNQKEKELHEVKKELRDKESKLNITVLSGLSSTRDTPLYSIDPTSGIIGLDEDLCFKCYKHYKLSDLIAGKCPNCGKDPKIDLTR